MYDIHKRNGLVINCKLSIFFNVRKVNNMTSLSSIT